MEAWTITKYVSPYLAINDVRFDASTGEVLVVSDADEYVIEHGDHLSGDDVVKRLESLRKPGSSSWKEVLSGSPDSEWFELLENMDYLGLLRDDATNIAKERRDSDLARVQAGIAKLVESVLAEVPAQQRERLVANLEVLGRHYSSLAWEIAREYPLRKPLPEVSHRPFSSAELLRLDNFYQQLAILQGLYQRNNAPLSLICNAKALFDLHTRLQGGPSKYADLSELLTELSGGAYSAIDALRHLNGLAEILVSGADPARSKRYATASYEPKECMSGIDFMLEAEKLACEVLHRVGSSKYVKALENPDALVLVHGRYLQDYRVTTRFPEIIAAILPKRLNDEMRAKAFRYYKEEVGHDVLEYESCRELGLTDEQIQSTEPLPLHFAYVDVFTQLGVIDPIAYTTSIFVTEGIIGAQSPLETAYKNLIGDFMSLDKHILLNEKYHHTSIPRLFMAEVKSVSPAVQRLAMDYLVLMLELNYRAWDDLLDFYHGRDYRFFRVLPKPVLSASQTSQPSQPS